MSSKLVYFILGAAGSGRREVLADLVSESLDREEVVVTYLSTGEAPSEHDQRLGRVERWAWTAAHSVDITLPDDASTVFIVLDGSHNPVDQLEALRSWLTQAGAELGRILCVVNCQLAHARPELAAWYDACIHFSDVVLLNRRQDVPNKWVSDFQERYRSQYLPCLIELVKEGRVKNPQLVLQAIALRISQAFEEDLPVLPPGVVIEDETDEDEDGEEDGDRSPDDEDELPTEDPYFQRKPGGRRVKDIPNIADFLPSKPKGA